MKQTLQNWLAEGKIAKVIEQLSAITTDDKDLQQEVLVIAARFAHYEKQLHGNTADADWLSKERNQINAALLYIIEKLPEKNTKSFSNKWLKIGGAIVAAIGIIASIAQISGYSLKDFFEKKETPANIQTMPKQEPKGEKVLPIQQEPKKEQAPEVHNHFEAKDQSKQINVPDNKGTININQ